MVFTRMPERQLTEHDVVAAFAGEYQFPGAPDLALIPTRGAKFNIKDQGGVSVEFKRDAAGKVTEAALDDNGTVIVLKKK